MDKKFLVNLHGDFSVIAKEKFIDFGFTEGALQEAKANTLIPKEFDVARNTDVMPVVFNLAVVNQFNLNDDGMDAETAIDALQHFKNKPINIEHKKDQIVGHIINASVSEKEPEFYERNAEEYRDKKTPFFITAAGVIYSNIFPDLAQALIEASDPTKEFYRSISTSWEIAFGFFNIVKGTEKNLIDGSVLSPEEKEQEIFNLKGFGGSGRTQNGERVMRLIQKPAYPLGAALTLNPAARVKGVYTGETLFEVLKKSQAKNKNNKISQSEKSNVREGKSHIMDKEQFEKFLATVKESLAGSNVSEANQANLVSQITQVLEKRSKEWETQKEAENQAKAQLEADLKEAKEKLEATEKTNADIQAQLNTIKAERAAEAKVALVQNRMGAVESKFDLTDEELQIVAAEVAQLGDTDEDFQSYAKKLDVIFAHKNKEEIAKKNAENNQDKKEDKKEDDKELQTDASKNTSKVPNSNKNQSEEEDLITRVVKNFVVGYTGQKK